MPIFCSQDDAKATMAAQTQAIFVDCGWEAGSQGELFVIPFCQIYAAVPLPGGHRHRVCEQKCLAGELPGGGWDGIVSLLMGLEIAPVVFSDMKCWFGMIWAFFVELQEEMISGSMSGWNSRWEIQRLNRIESCLLKSRKAQGFTLKL